MLLYFEYNMRYNFLFKKKKELKNITIKKKKSNFEFLLLYIVEVKIYIIKNVILVQNTIFLPLFVINLKLTIFAL